MKFTQVLRLQTKEEWSTYYLHYKRLHQLINRIVFAYQSGSLETLAGTKIRHNPYQDPRAFSLLASNSSISENDSEDDAPDGVDRLYTPDGDDDDDEDDDFIAPEAQRQHGHQTVNKRTNQNVVLTQRDDTDASVYRQQFESTLDPLHLDLDSQTVDSVGITIPPSVAFTQPHEPTSSHDHHYRPGESTTPTCTVPYHQHYGTLETEYGQNIAQHQRIRYRLSSQATEPYFTHLMSDQQRMRYQSDRLDDATQEEHEVTSTRETSRPQDTSNEHPPFSSLLTTFPQLQGDGDLLEKAPISAYPSNSETGDAISIRSGDVEDEDDHSEGDDVVPQEDAHLMSPQSSILTSTPTITTSSSTSGGPSSSIRNVLKPNISFSSLTSLFKPTGSHRESTPLIHKSKRHQDKSSMKHAATGDADTLAAPRSSHIESKHLQKKDRDKLYYLDMYETAQSEFFYTLFSDMNRVNTFYLQMASELCSKLDAVLLEPDMYAHRAPFIFPNTVSTPRSGSTAYDQQTQNPSQRKKKPTKGKHDAKRGPYKTATDSVTTSPNPRNKYPSTVPSHAHAPSNQPDYLQYSYQQPASDSSSSEKMNTDGPQPAALAEGELHQSKNARDTLVHDDHRYHSILSTYEQICELKQFCQLNTTGFMKILSRYAQNHPQRLNSQGKRVGINNRLVKVAFQELRGCDFVKHDKLHRLTTTCYNLISREKLLSIEHTVRTQRKDELIAKTHGLYVTIKWTPLMVSICLFFIILLLPLDLVSELRTRFSPNPLYAPKIKSYPHPTDGQFYTRIQSARYDVMLPIPFDKDTKMPLFKKSSHISHIPVLFHPRDGDSAQIAPKSAKKDHMIDLEGMNVALNPLDDPKYRMFIENNPYTVAKVEYHDKSTPDTPLNGLPGTPPHYELYLAHVNKQAHKCLGLLTLAVLLWVTESVPYFCTALIIPIIAVLLGISYNEDGLLLSAKQAAMYLPTRFFSQTSTLILLGFTLTAAFSKAQLEMRLISFFHSYFGHNPYYFILSITMLGWFMSLWLNNKSAHLICMAFLMPVMNEVGSKTRFTKALLLSLTLGCNIGGAGSPIASLQNVLAVSALSSINIDINFLQWLAVSIPFSLAAIACIFALVVTLVPPTDVSNIPVIMYKRQPISPTHYAVIISSAVTILALVFLSSSLIVHTVGGISTIAFCYMAFIFSTNILSVFDFNSYAWHLIMLIGGGSVLGECIKHSQLMNIIAESLLVSLPFTFSRYIVYAQLIFVVLVMTSFISHTVGALILMPLLLQIGIEMGMPTMVCISSALAINVAMMLPFSSFPNLNAVSCRNESGEPYLESMMDLIIPGTILSFVCYAIIITLGYGLILLFM